MQRKHSKKREEILSLLLCTKSHPSAEWIYAKLKPAIPDLSLATVYRNLTLFRQSGEVVSVGVVNGQERFDADTTPHAHFVCRMCDSVIDVESDCTRDIDIEKISMDLGANINGMEIVFRGICKNCIGK